MLDKLFKQHPYIAAWGVLELVYLVSLMVWMLLSSGSFGDVFVAGFLIPSIICSAIFGVGWKRKH